MIRIEGTNPTDVYTIKTGAVANEDHLAAINADDEVLNAADNAAIKVLGIFYRVDDENNKAEIRDGIFLLKNSVANPLKRNDRGAIAYVEDSETVSSDPGNNSVVAGVVIDVSSEGVFVDTRPSVYIKGDTGTGTPGANGSVPGGIYTADADDATATSLTIDTGLDTVTSYAVQIRRAGVLIADDAVVSEAAGVLTVANGSSYTITDGDKIHWLAAGTVAAE